MENDHIHVKINVPTSFKIANTKANYKFIIVFLRLICGENGKTICTFQQIANMLGYADRRNINNFWREFEMCNFDLLSFLTRKVQLTSYMPLLEDFVADNLILPINEMHRKFVDVHKIQMSYPSFKKYVSQVCSLKILKKFQNLLNQRLQGSGAINILKLLANQDNVPKICDRMLSNTKPNTSEPKPESLLKSTLSRQNLCLLVHYLIASGLNL